MLLFSRGRILPYYTLVFLNIHFSPRGAFFCQLTVSCLVSPWSVANPCLYINDLEKNIKYRVKFYADDTMLFSVVQDPYISVEDLNADLKTISQCAHQWQMEFKADPNKQATEMLFSQNKI